MEITNFIYVTICLILGIFIGYVLKLEKRIEKFAQLIKKTFKSSDQNFITGFLSSTLVACVGSMAIIAAIDEGVKSNNEVFYLKSLLDFMTTMIFASKLGAGAIAAFITRFYI